MGQLPIGIGNRSAQARFIRSHQDFLLEHPAVHQLLEKVSLRTLRSPPQSEVDQLLKLPEDSPAVTEFEDQVMADRVVFGLGRVIADDFAEILLLSGNAHGIGAYKILRGMYERLVTAVYISQNPQEARHFVEDCAVKKWKLWQQALEVMPDLKHNATSEEIAGLEVEYRRVRTKRAESICNKCGQPKTHEAWTRVDLASMAKQADINLSALYGACYLTPTFHSHATGFGLGARFKRDDKRITYKEISESEARQAIMLAHNLVIRHLTLQNEYFKLGLDREIGMRVAAFLRIWKRPDQSPEPTEQQPTVE